jgi:hypothetical protein
LRITLGFSDAIKDVRIASMEAEWSLVELESVVFAEQQV